MFFAGGTLSLIAGVIGIFLPLLPTTPFLLLAAFCYARSSGRIYRWLMTNRWFGEYLKNYRDGKGIPLKLKVCKIALLWLMIGTVACFVVTLWWVRLILLGIASGVTLHLKLHRLCQEIDKLPDGDQQVGSTRVKSSAACSIA